MKQNITITKTFIFAAAIALGATVASAQNANVAVPTPSQTVSGGLLGSRYTEATYKYIDLKGGDHADGFGLTYNQPLNAGFDFVSNYQWAKADLSGFDVRVQDLDVGVKAFSALSWGKPYVLAAVGWEWQKAAGIRDHSFTYTVGVGAEFQATAALTVTPYVNFFRATAFNSSEIDPGVKVAYRLNNAWSLTARVQYDDVRHGNESIEYSIGAAYHF
jgi:opacity protein-like surface antigen